MDSDIRRDLAANWQILLAATAGWALDAFDFTMQLFLVPHLGHVFGVSLKAMALAVTVTGLAKVAGSIFWGKMADRYGRKLPFMLAVLWFSVFSALTGLAWNYTSFVVLRILFGFGFGGEWSTSAALLTESVTPRARGIASGIMMAGYEVGYFLTAFCFFKIFPVVGWRWMFVLGALPALLTIFVRFGVKESPIWQAGKAARRAVPKLHISPAVLQGWAFMACLNFMGLSIFALYPTFLIQARHLTPAGVFPFIATYSAASIIGKPLAGYLVQKYGERPVMLTYFLLTIPSTLLYTLIDAHWSMIVGAILVGLIANGIFGAEPAYLARRFPSQSRGLGVGIGYAMTFFSVSAPYVIASFTPHFGLPAAMTGAIIAGALLAGLIAALPTTRWLNPAETSESVDVDSVRGAMQL